MTSGISTADFDRIGTGRTGFIAANGLWTEAQQQRAGEILEEVTQRGLEVIRVVFVDPHGLTRSKSMSVNSFRASLENGVDSSPGGFIFDTGLDLVFNPFEHGGGLAKSEMTGAADLILVPDPTTFRVLPWCQNTGWILCDEYLKTGRPLPYSSRLLLKEILEKLSKSHDLTMLVGLEVEWYLTRLIDPRITVDAIGGFGRPGEAPLVAPLNLGYQFMSENLCDAVEDDIRDLRRALLDLGLPLRTTEHESGPGQLEFTFAPMDALAAADAMILLRNAAKQMSGRRGLHATFMCAPQLQGFDASGWHLHQSLVDGTGRNAFMSDDPDLLVSELARHYAGGLIANAPAATAFAAPTVNGYKRLSDRFSLSPDRATWSADNRGTYLRVLAEHGDPSSHLENRVGEPAANPYLYIAGQLVAGMNGVSEQLDPGEMTVDPHASDLPRLPQSLKEAVDALDASAVFRKEMGDEYINYFVALKRNEWRRYTEDLAANGIEDDQNVVTDWEQREYFRNY